MDFCRRATRSMLFLPPKLSGVILETAILVLCILSVTAQYGDFYSNLEALFSGKNPNPTSSTTKTPRLTPRSFISLGQLLALDQPAETPRPKHTPPPASLNPRVSQTRGTPARSSINQMSPRGSPSPNDLFTMMNLNSWQGIPPNLFASSSSPSEASRRVAPASPSGKKPGSSWQGISFSDSGPPQSLNWDYSANGLDHGSNTGLESGNMVGGSAGGAQEPFLPLADHSPGSSMADQPGQMVDWSAPPLSKDTYKYDDEPTPKPKPPADGESMAKAILRGQVRRWEWNYSTRLLQGELSGRSYSGNYDNSVQCCHRLPYICGVDGMCVIDKNECKEFCVCAANPSMPHCIRDVIPRIKKTMAVLETRILERVSVELNLPMPVPLPQASPTLAEALTTTTLTTSTRRSAPFIQSRKSTTKTTTKRPTTRQEVATQQTNTKTPSLMPQAKSYNWRDQSRDITTNKDLASNSPLPPSSSTTQMTTSQAIETTRRYNIFMYRPLISTPSPTITHRVELKNTQLTSEPTPAATTTRRSMPSTNTTPLANPFQFALPTTESTLDVNLERRSFRTKNLVYKTPATPPPKDSVVLVPTPKTTNFMDSMMLQPDGLAEGSIHGVDSFNGMLEVTTGSSDRNDPNNTTLSQNLIRSVISTTSSFMSTITEAATQIITDRSSPPPIGDSTVRADISGSSDLPFEKHVLISSEQKLDSFSENGTRGENTSLQDTTTSSSKLEAKETTGFIIRGTTENWISVEAVTTSDSSLTGTEIITKEESDAVVSLTSTAMSGPTSAMTTTADTHVSESTVSSSTTAATAPNTTPKFSSSSTAATSPMYRLSDHSISTASPLHQQKTTEYVLSRDFTVTINTTESSSPEPGFSVDLTTQPDSRATEAAGEFTKTSNNSGTTEDLPTTSPPLGTTDSQPSLTTEVDPTLTPNGTANVDPTLTPNGAANVDPTLTPNGAADVDPTLIPNGAASVDPTLTPNGTANVDPTLTPNGTADVDPTLIPNGAANVDPTLTPNGTANDAPTRSPIFGFVSSFNASLQNRSDLIDGAQENDFLAWFNQNNSRKDHLPNSDQGMSSAPRASPAPHGDMDTPCGYECDKKGGRCLMGEDFKPHCLFMEGDPCDHFKCINGMCAPTDGLYACSCSLGWTGTFCEQPCWVDCGEHGVCGRVGDNMTGCICDFNYTGDRCSDKKKFRPAVTVTVPMDGLKAWEVAVVAVVTAVCLGLVFVLLPYILWRRQWLPMRQLVFYFQEYEDDDDKEYDAFISYKSTPRDERFILHHLYPRLEKELDFRLCLHFRDFPPGEPIANNIIHAIENSRRTIMVLSPSYVASEWCRMEYQKAQYEMLRLKHKIIPIVLEDVSGMPEMDANLRTIMDTVTYIEWPGEEEPCTSKRVAKFWKLLELSMPKKKDLSRSLSSLGSCSSELPLTSVSKTCFNSIVTSLLSDDVFTSSSLKSCSSSLSKLSIGGSTCGGGGGSSDRKSSGEGSSAVVKTDSEDGTTAKTMDSDSERNPESETSTVSLRSKELFEETFVAAPSARVVCRNVGLPRPQTDTELCKKEVGLTQGQCARQRKGSVPVHVGQSPAQCDQYPALVSQPPALLGQLPALVVQTPSSAAVKVTPVDRPKPQLSSDDFIVEIREVGAQGKQIQITSRPPRKYASQLLV